MNVSGILGSLCFPSFPGLSGELFNQQPDKELARAMIEAYNDWHIDGWCGAYPGRFIPLVLPHDVGSGAAGRRGAARREEGLSRHDLLGQPGQHRPAEPAQRALGSVLEGVLDEGTVVCMHIGSGTGMSFTTPMAPPRS